MMADFTSEDGPISVHCSDQCRRAGGMRAGHRGAADVAVCSKGNRECGINVYARAGDIRLLNVLIRRRVGTAQAEIGQNIALDRNSSVEREIDCCSGGICVHKRGESVACCLGQICCKLGRLAVL